MRGSQDPGEGAAPQRLSKPHLLLGTHLMLCSV